MKSFPCCVIPILSKRFKPVELSTIFKPCVSHLECLERDKKRYPGQKTMQSDVLFLRPPIIKLIKEQVCDNYHLYTRSEGDSAEYSSK